MAFKGGLIGNDNLFVPDAPTIGDASAGNAEVSVAFTAPSDVGNDAITSFAARVTDGTNIFNGTASSSPITVTGLSNGTSYTAQVWAINDYGNGPLSAATSSFSPAAPVGIWSGGDTGSHSNVIDYVTIASTGTAQDFGDQTRATSKGSSVSSSTRGVMYIGAQTAIGRTNEIDKLTIASTGDSTDFGDITNNRSNTAGASNDTRGLFMGGTDGSADETVDYVTIASDGNAINFGDLTQARAGPANGTSSSTTRAVAAGGDASGITNVIDYRAIASTGNFSDFGDLTVSGPYPAACSSATRIVFAGINSGNTINFITTASTGNASDFGDLLAANGMGKTGVSSKTIGLIGGGNGPINNIDKITIASAANATDFGDLTVARRFCNGGVSSAHGGLA